MEMADALESDLSRLPDLTLDSILKTLNERFNRDLPYTNVRDILIAINPEKPLSLYDEQSHDEYHWDQFVPDQAPHVFQVAAEAYKRMRNTETNQVIIVSGESGAGKTETTKFMVRHLIHMCQKDDMQLHEKIMRINPLLEAYGNAKTTINGNSSRFAKYLEISFKEDWQLAGAVVRDYMLEKSRVVHQGAHEGIFHIFYALFAGCNIDKDMREDLFLEHGPNKYRIMCSDDESMANIPKYETMYKETVEVLKLINVDTSILNVMLAAVIHITEIDFEEDEKGVAQIKDSAPFVHAAMLLSLDVDVLGGALIASSRTLRETTVATYKTVKEARDGRDALAKVLYERMFEWLVRQINSDLQPIRSGADVGGSIGILDIAGFEKLQNNSFEQMLINIVNEKLQSFMNDRIFKMEMEIYEEEGIPLDGINFVSNQDILDMFENRKVGILDILDEVSNFRQGSDNSFTNQIRNKYSDHPKFEASRMDTMFGIHHFAAMVPYNAEGFIEKNRDRLNSELMSVMKASSDGFISDLFTVKRGPTGTISAEQHNYRASTRGVKVMTSKKVELRPTPQGHALAQELGKSLKKKFGTVRLPQQNASGRVAPAQPEKTIVSFFRNSLGDLLDKLRSGQPFFIRCLKANSQHLPDSFDQQMVAAQLRYNGLAEVAKIRRMGYAIRRPLREFEARYKAAHSFIKWPSDTKACVQKILLRTPQSYHRDYRIGKSMVFMRHELDEHMERLLALRRQTAASTVTRCVRKVSEVKKQERLERERRERERREAERREAQRREAARREEEARKKELESQQQPDYPDGRDVLDNGYKLGHTENTAIPFRNSVSARGDYKAGRVGNSLMGGSSRQQPPPYNGGASHRPGNESSDSSMSSTYDFVPPTTNSKQNGRSPSPTIEEPSPKKTKKKPRLEFWDLPQLIARERKIRDVHEDRGLQVIKVVTYIVMFLVLLWCAVAQKISFLTLVSYQYPLSVNQTETQIKERAVVSAGRHFLVALAIMIPYCLTLLQSSFKWMFGSFLFPSKSTLFFTCLTELLHSVGLCILCFIILPDMDIVRAIILMNGVAAIPAMLFPVCASDVKLQDDEGEVHKHKPTINTLAVFCFNVLTAIIQLGFIPLILVTDNFLSTSHVDTDIVLIALFIIAMLFVSCSWWENFVDDRFCGTTSQRSFVKSTLLVIKFELQESRPVVSFFTSLLKIAVTVFLTYVTKSFKPFQDTVNSEHHRIDDVTFSDAFAKLGDMPLKENTAILTLTLSAFAGYYVGYTACKLKLQRFSFNLPLLLSTPIAVILASVDCDSDLFSPFTNEEQNRCKPEDDLMDKFFVYIIGLIVWGSLYWLCRHIFHPNIERLAKTERLFMSPFYCSILFEQHMLLNRRRHNRKVNRVLKEDREYYSLSEFNSKVNIEGEEVDDKRSVSEIDDHDEDIHSDKYRNRKFRDVPTIYACATMWHENKQEMVQLMKSIFRMDRDQNLRRTAELLSGKKDKDFYEFEAHIFFDDAMELDDDEEMVPNSFVRLLMTILNESASAVYEQRMDLKHKYIVPSPYGGQVLISMPGDNFLFVHLKDKAKIRHKKRWSQVMYMYYLLGFRIVRMCQETVEAALQQNKINELLGWEDDSKVAVGAVGKSHIFQAFDEQVLRKASNTFLLALDGDVDFSPGAVRLLVDRMRKSEKVGAACGRIHPIGTGPVVWFQKFEYAIAHWLQKATEHVLGCVLCSPGCFSMFRGSALMDDNVMKKYTILPTEPSHHLMYDQGEDRWLCTLLLQQGYRVDYAAGSDAFTYAPEGFGEFFNQRRRWMPSTVFNIIDLLADYQNTVYINSNISMLYIFYQGSLLLSTVIGPATIIMMIAGANMIVFGVSLVESYIMAMIPAIFYFVICFYVNTKLQVQIAEIMTGIYAFIMMIVFVGTIVTAAQESILHPSVLFIMFLVAAFSFSACLHPKEWTCVIYGALYFILIPTGFLLLVIYSLTNMHVISWGTREVPKKKTKAEMEEEKRLAEEKKKKKEKGFFGRFLPKLPTADVKEFLTKLTDARASNNATVGSDGETVQILKQISDSMNKLVEQKGGEGKKTAFGGATVRYEDGADETELKGIAVTKPKGILKTTKTDSDKEQAKGEGISRQSSVTISEEEPTVKVTRDELKNPKWAEIDELKDCKKIDMMPEELKFWEDFLQKYLKPLEIDENTKKKTAEGLLELRTNICVGMAITNLLWIAINFMFQYTNPTHIDIGGSSSDSGLDLEEELENGDTDDGPISGLKVDVLGLLFVIFFMVILIIQFAGMILHRWGTFLHLVSVTRLMNPFHMRTMGKFAGGKGKGGKDDKARKREIKPQEAYHICEEILQEPLPDYDMDSDEDDPEEEARQKDQIERLQRTGTKLGISYKDNKFGASTRLLDNNDYKRDLLAQSPLSMTARIIRDGMRATGGRTQAVDREHQMERAQMNYRMQNDKYIDRPLPPVRRRRYNFGPGRRYMSRKFESYLERQSPRPGSEDLIPEEGGTEPDDRVYDAIRSQGTIGRQLGRKLKLYAKTASHVRFDEDSPRYRHYGPRASDTRM